MPARPPVTNVLNSRKVNKIRSQTTPAAAITVPYRARADERQSLLGNGPNTGRKTMSILASTVKLLAAGVWAGVAGMALTAGALAQQQASPPDFSSGSARWRQPDAQRSRPSAHQQPTGGSNRQAADLLHCRSQQHDSQALGRRPHE